MKQRILLTFSMSALGALMFAQTTSGGTLRNIIQKSQPAPTPVPNGLNVFRPATSANYNWDIMSNTWSFADSTFFVYNTQGMVTSETHGASGTFYYRNLTTYDAQYRITLEENQTYDLGTSTWVSSGKTVMTYDAQGNQLLNEYSYYDGGTMQWVVSYGNQYTYTYNAQNQLLEKVYLTYDSGTSTYVNDSKEANYTYNAFGNPLSFEEQTWDGTQWVPMDKITYTYDVNGFPTAAEMLEWDGMAYISMYRFVDVLWYNWTGSFDDAQMLSNTMLGYDDIAMAWDTLQRNTNTYGSYGSSIELYENYVGGGVFENASRNTYTYDAQGNSILYGSEYWDNSTDNWIVDYQTADIYTYDANNYMLQDINQQWDNTTLALVNSMRHDYADYQTYDNTTAVATNDTASIGVYPNPMTEVATIDLSAVKNATSVRLIDLSGTVVKTMCVDPSANLSLRKEELKSGMYFVQVMEGNHVLAQTKLSVN